MRAFADLPGFIDCVVFLQNGIIPEQEMLQSIPICHCEVPTQILISFLNNLLIRK
jgi:hypothetical protein